MSSQRALMEAGRPYRADDPELVAARRACLARCALYNALDESEDAARGALLRALLGEVGERVDVRPPLRCDYGSLITIGPRTFVNYELIVLDGARVTIGADVQIGPRVQLLTATHPLDPEERASGVESCAPITIEDGVWLGAGAIICPGVTIGAGTTVGAGAVVTADLPACVLAVGVPARVVRAL